MNHRDELRELVNRLIDEKLSPTETARLNELLRGDPDACEYYLDFMSVHAQLDREFGAVVPAGSVPGLSVKLGAAGQAGPRRRKWNAWIGAGAAAAAVVVATLLIQRQIPGALRAPAVSDYVATLVEQSAAKWSGDRQMFHGQRLTGGRLQLESGRAVINMDAGARIVLVAPSDITIESAGGMRLNSGKIAVRAPEEAFGFQVATADGALVDWGTEFTLAADKRGGTECHVLEGEVEWRPSGGAKQIARLVEGEARRFLEGRAEPIAAETTRFRDYLPKPVRQNPPAELLAYEPFDYPAGQPIADTLNSGTGWRSPWRGRFATGDTIDPEPRMQIVREAVPMAAKELTAPSGGAFVFHEPKQWRLRELATPIDFGRDGAYYLSFLVRRPAHTGDPDHKSGRLVVTLRSLADYWSHSVGFAITSGNRPVILADGNNNSADITVPVEAPLFVVCKITTSERGPDQLFLKVYTPGEPIDFHDTTRWTVTGRGLELESQMDHLIVGMMGDVRWVLDELRYGTSWRAVVPLRMERFAAGE